MAGGMGGCLANGDPRVGHWWGIPGEQVLRLLSQADGLGSLLSPGGPIAHAADDVGLQEHVLASLGMGQCCSVMLCNCIELPQILCQPGDLFLLSACDMPFRHH